MRDYSMKSTSKFLSLILRHKPEVIGIELDEHGWANVDELIAGIGKSRKFDMHMLEQIVAEDEKQRYSFKLRRRYSPGYFDLDIKNQTKIFRLLELTKRCGITLTNKMLMIPSKSVTAIIGVEDEN